MIDRLLAHSYQGEYVIKLCTALTPLTTIVYLWSAQHYAYPAGKQYQINIESTLDLCLDIDSSLI
jgi:hypothetical protein